MTADLCFFQTKSGNCGFLPQLQPDECCTGINVMEGRVAWPGALSLRCGPKELLAQMLLNFRCNNKVREIKCRLRTVSAMLSICKFDSLYRSNPECPQMSGNASYAGVESLHFFSSNTIRSNYLCLPNVQRCLLLLLTGLL